MRAVGGLCLEVSLGTWEPDSFLYFFSDRNYFLFCFAKVDADWVRPPRPKGDVETQTTYGPQTPKRGLYAQWGIHPPRLVINVPCEGRRTRDSSQVLRPKGTFFSLSGQALKQDKGSHSLEWVSTPHRGKTVLLLCSDSIIVGLNKICLGQTRY